LDCCESTARKALNDCKARFIVDGLSHLFFEPDVATVAIHRRRRLKAEKAKREAKAKRAA
jgi:hypothetical protein